MLRRPAAWQQLSNVVAWAASAHRDAAVEAFGAVHVARRGCTSDRRRVPSPRATSVGAARYRPSKAAHPRRRPPPRTQTLHMNLGNGLSATVHVEEARPQLSHEEKGQANPVKVQRRKMEETDVALSAPTTTTSSTDEMVLVHGQPADIQRSVDVLIKRLVHYDTVVDDHARFCGGASARSVRQQLVETHLPFLFQLSNTIYPALEASAKAAGSTEGRPDLVEAAAAWTASMSLPPLSSSSSSSSAPSSAAEGSEDKEALSVRTATTTTPDAVSVAALTAAQEALVAWLAVIESTAAHTGRRYEPALPAALVAALWMHVMPTLHVLARRSSECSPSQWQSYRRLRQQLAHRARDGVDRLSPPVVARVLTRLQQCGALADDILGPVATTLLETQRHHLLAVAPQSSTFVVGTPGSPVAMNYSLLSHDVHPVASSAPQHLLFGGADALTMARLIGRAAVPDHFQLHTLVHTVLLPVVGQELRHARQCLDAASAVAVQGRGAEVEEEAWVALVPPRAALLDLTRCFVHYAVSGHTADDLIALWLFHARAAETLAGTRDAEGEPELGESGAANSRLALRECNELLRLLSTSPASRQASRDVAAEAYLPLAEHLCEQIVRLAPRCLAQTATETDLDRCLDVGTALDLLNGLLGVDSVQWAEAYSASATLAMQALATRLAFTGADAALVASLQSFLRALRRRGSQRVPDHPFHALAARTLLHSTDAETDVRVAGAALLSVALLVPEATALASSTDEAAEAQAGSVVLHSTDAAEDSARTLALLRLHGLQLPVTAFCAALVRAPLAQLSLAEQTALLQHLTASASSVPPVWLARAMSACAQGMPLTVLDPISVQRLSARFTAHDVVRRLPLAEASAVLLVVSRDEVTAANNALSTAALVRHVGVRLRQDVDRPGGQTQLETLGDLPAVVHALQQSHSFFVHLFSRACRVLLGQVEEAPWPILLPAFAAVAEEYTRRSPAQSRGTVFRDAWQLVRDRVLEAATSPSDSAEALSLDDVLQALNAFAVLDVQDLPLFSVLTYALAGRCQDALAAAPVPAHTEDGTTDQSGATFDVQVPEDVAGDVHADAADETDSAARAVEARVALGEYVMARLTPSAVAAVATSLLRRMDAPGEAAPAPAPAQHMLTSWLLMALGRGARDLYPVDVVCAMPALTRFIAAYPSEPADDGDAEAVAEHALTLELARRAYDACRAMFLLMYEDAAAVDAGAVASAPPAAEVEADDVDVLTSESARQALVSRRVQWPAKALASIHAVPRPLFATVLTELTTSGWLDKPVAVACAARICVRRVCQETLTVQSLIDVTMSLCVQLSEASEAARSAEPSPAQQTAAQKFLPVVLNAVWERADELSVAQVDALLRFMRHQFGTKLDQDFVDRLLAQRDALTTETKSQAKTQSQAGPAPAQTSAVPPPTEAPAPETVMQADDLFELM